MNGSARLLSFFAADSSRGCNAHSQQRSEYDIGCGSHDGLRSDQEGYARRHPQPDQQGEARNRHGAELITCYDRQRKTEQHLVRMSRWRRNGRKATAEADKPQH